MRRRYYSAARLSTQQNLHHAQVYTLVTGRSERNGLVDKTASVSRGMVWSTFGDTKRTSAIGQQGQCGRAVKVIERFETSAGLAHIDGCERALSPRDDQERRAFKDASGPDGTFSGTGTSGDDVAVRVRRALLTSPVRAESSAAIARRPRFDGHRICSRAAAAGSSSDTPRRTSPTGHLRPLSWR